MDENKTPAKISRKDLFAGQLLVDSFGLAVAGAVLTTIAGGSGFFFALLHVFLAFLALFLTSLFVHAIFNASRESLPRKLLGWASMSGLLYLVYVQWLGEMAVYLAVGGFAATAIHTLILHPRQDAEYRSEKAEEAGNRLLAEHLALAAQGDEKRALPKSVEQALTDLPVDLDPELQGLVTAAMDDFSHLQELVNDPALATSFGRDNVALLREAEAVLVEVLRRAPLVARVKKLAGERADDHDGQAAAQSAEDRLRQKTAALHDAASAALQLAANGSDDAADDLREHIDGLYALREARDEIERELSHG